MSSSLPVGEVDAPPEEVSTHSPNMTPTYRTPGTHLLRPCPGSPLRSGTRKGGRLKQRLVPIDVPLDLKRTLAPLGGRFDADGWWRATRTPEGPATLRLERVGAGIRATAWGSGADWVLEHVPRWIGLHDEPEALVTDHRIVGPLARRHRGMRFGATRLVFEALVVGIVSQKVAGKEAGMSLRHLWRRFGDPAPGPNALQLSPDPERLADAPYWEYHPLGIERRRAEVLRRVAADHRRIERLADASSTDAQRWLQRYRGVGVWTAAETVAISHGDPDAVSVGDYHHRHIVTWHLTGRPRGTDEEMLRLLEPFRPHRARVVRLLTTLGHEPAFGPRMPLRRIANA